MAVAVKGRGDRMDALLAAAIAAWATISVPIGLLLVLTNSVGSADPVATLVFLAGALIMALFFTFIVTAIVGWPALLLVETFNLTQKWQVALVGAAAGLFVAMVLMFIGTAGVTRQLSANDAFGFVIVVAAGALAGMAAWNVCWRTREE